MKKTVTIVLIIFLVSLLALTSYQYYETSQKYSDQEKELTEKKKEVDKKYTELVNMLKETEVDIESDKDAASDKVSLLTITKENNAVFLEESQEDVARLTKENNEIEKTIIRLKEQAEALKNITITDKQITYSQYPEYPTGCESIALYILLRYYNIDVSPDDIINSIKKGELPYTENGIKYGGNPEVEFIGDPRNNYSYGVYNKPLADVANKYKAGINSKTGLEFDEVLKLLDQKKPVLAWTTINLSTPFISQEWTYKETGEKIRWISGEHAVVLIGYNQNQVIASDPYTGTIRYFDKNTFVSRYNYLGKRVLYY